VESRSDISQALRSEIAYYFGSLRDAEIALKTDRRLLNGRSKPKIITVLAKVHRSKEKLNYNGATGRSRLGECCRSLFWKLGKALYAAGMTPLFHLPYFTCNQLQLGLSIRPQLRFVVYHRGLAHSARFSVRDNIISLAGATVKNQLTSVWVLLLPVRY
jgi:hypothetical protein